MKACLCFIRHCLPVLCSTDFYGGYIADLRAQHRAFSSALHVCRISLAVEGFPGLHLCFQACRTFKMMYLRVACILQRLLETSAFSFTTAMVRVSSQPPLKCHYESSVRSLIYVFPAPQPMGLLPTVILLWRCSRQANKGAWVQASWCALRLWRKHLMPCTTWSKQRA